MFELMRDLRLTVPSAKWRRVGSKICRARFGLVAVSVAHVDGIYRVYVHGDWQPSFYVEHGSLRMALRRAVAHTRKQAQRARREADGWAMATEALCSR